MQYNERGLEILAFPCNNFGGQEPGSNEAIQAFAASRGATFPVLGKLECENGDKTHPVYAYLKDSISGWLGSGLKWNFAKFLANKDGIPIQRYLPITNPLAIEPDIVKLLEEAEESESKTDL